MDISLVTKNIVKSAIATVTGALVITSLNALTNSLKKSGNENPENMVLAVATTGMLAGAYASTMPSVTENDYVDAAVSGATNACGIVALYKVVNMGTGIVQRDAEGKPKLDPVTNQPMMAPLKVPYGLAAPQIPTMTDFGMQSPNVTDVEYPAENGGIAGVPTAAVGL